jgi:hypothetical protein
MKYWLPQKLNIVNTPDSIETVAANPKFLQYRHKHIFLPEVGENG